MEKSKATSIVAVVLALAPIALLAAACSRPPEQQLLTQFFRASRARDNATTSVMSAVTIDPRDKGTVESFSITSIGEEKRAPLSFNSYFDAIDKANAENDAFLKTKVDYQLARQKALEDMLKAADSPNAKLTPAQAQLKAEWDKWREGISTHARAVSDAKKALAEATGTAEASLSQPGQAPLDPKTFDGETISKDVAVAAKVKTPEGAEVDKTLTITLTRVAGTLGGTKREGRPIITKIDGI
ncbi:MAG: hypothetical protein ABI665_16555 [Vicinamibacterales bacterium]